MNSYNLRLAAAAALILGASGCGLLDVTNPTVIKDTDVATATGADLLRRDAVRRLYLALGEGVVITGILSDELAGRETELDERSVTTTSGNNLYTQWNEVRRAASLAIPQLRQTGADATKQAFLGEMFAVRGYATLGLAENFCPGFPLHEIVDLKPVFGGPLTTSEAFDHALAEFDSALAYAGDSARILNAARIGRARALLGLKRFDEAANAAGAVSSAFVWKGEYSATQRNFLGRLWSSNQFISVGNREGSNGLDFVGAQDPRLPVSAFNIYTDVDRVYRANKYPDGNASIVIASGVEARLIEAEVALQKDDAAWLTILNTLRQTQMSPPMTALSDPGTTASRVDLLFRERGFWLYGTAHRLGDLRRLVRDYGRTADSVFPTGTYYFAGIPIYPEGVYSTATSLQFPAELETPYNAAVTGCTD